MEYSDGQTETWGKRGDHFPNPIVQFSHLRYCSWCTFKRIPNIFVPKYQTKYEYRIYSFLVTWTNMNIEYLSCNLLMTPLYHKVNFE